jgi:xanthine/uracil permease
MENTTVSKETRRRKRIMKIALGIVIGGLAGYLYYYFIGCDGTCPISSNPWRSILSGSVVGTLLGSTF